MTTISTKTVAPKTIPPLPPDLAAGLRRLKLATVRRTAGQSPIDRQDTTVDTRRIVAHPCGGRDRRPRCSNTANRLKGAAFPVIKTLECFDVSASSISATTVDYRANLEWIRAQHNLAIIGPPGTGESDVLIGLGHAAARAGHTVRYFTAADLVDTLYRGKPRKYNLGR